MNYSLKKKRLSKVILTLMIITCLTININVTAANSKTNVETESEDPNVTEESSAETEATKEGASDEERETDSTDPTDPSETPVEESSSDSPEMDTESSETSVNSMIATMSVKSVLKGYVTGDTVNVRKGDSTGYDIITTLNKNHPVEILEQSSGTSWYKIKFTKDGTSYTGWMSNQYIRIELNPSDNQEFENYLNKQEFPESYKPYLRVLHALHPNWEFVALHTKLDWNTVIKNQINPVDRSLVPATSISSWKSIEQTAYNWDKGTWYNIEPGWVAASSEILQYFLDPRNSLVSSGEILQFLSLGWTGKETKAGVESIIKGSFMDKSSLDYVKYFMEAGQMHGISAYHLASRVIQEVGKNGSKSVEGPYYNFYNIKATGSNPVEAGLKYAEEQGWNTPEKSIKEGADFIARGYIKKGQDSLYLQKFDVVDGGNGYYWHQYMTNIQAPSNEAIKMKSTYPDFNNSSLVLKIPVYLNMPSSACIKPTLDGSPNYLLSELTVSGYSLTPAFNKFTTSYDLIVPESVPSISISASPVLSSTKITGTGKHNLTKGQNQIKITSTAQNGKSIVYTINISRGTSDYTSATDYKIGSTYITGIKPDTTVDQFIKNMKVSNATVTVLTSTGSKKTGILGTGNRVQIKQGDKLLDEYQALVYGDTNGVGTITIVDLANVQKHLLNVKKLSGIYYQAANTKKNGNNITIVDLANIQKHLLNVKQISQ